MTAPASPRFAQGLVVGKFSPLHKGHQHLIRFAQAQCERLLVLSWSLPEFRHCAAPERALWLAELHPDVQHLVLDPARLDALCAQRSVPPRPLPPNDASDDEARDFVAWLLTDLLWQPVQAVFTSEAYGEGFAQHLTRRFAERGWPAVAHVPCELNRATWPISGTRLRQEPALQRDWLDPRVAADLVPRVAVLGAESSGKTTLAQALAQALGTRWVPEYGREHWLACEGRLQFDDLLHIAQTQLRLERQAAPAAKGWLVCDTTPLTTLFYSRQLFQRAHPELDRLAERSYDRVVLCEPDFPFQQDGTRQGAEFSRLQHDWTRAQLRQRGVPVFHALGPLQERVQGVLAWLEKTRFDR
jgi:NadR type nicotinamide-nucleotide adenylyltransferase